MWNVHDIKRLIQTKNLPSKVNIDREIEYKSKRKNNIKKIKKSKIINENLTLFKEFL